MSRKHICGVRGSYPTFAGLRKHDNGSADVDVEIAASLKKDTLGNSSQEKMQGKVRMLIQGQKLMSIRKLRVQ